MFLSGWFEAFFSVDDHGGKTRHTGGKEVNTGRCINVAITCRESVVVPWSDNGWSMTRGSKWVDAGDAASFVVVCVGDAASD